MSLRVIVGAGAAARTAARLFADDGERVRIVTRSGGGPEHPLVERIALDAGDPADADRLARLAEGADTVFNCAITPYHTWPTTVPPLYRAILAAAERSGADYVMLGNVYGYGPVDGPLTEEHPLDATGPKGRVRARMWEEAAEAHAAGRVRATEVRAGQFLGAGVLSVFTLTVQAQVLAGRLALTPQELDTPHGYAATDDVARALVAVARDDRSWGRPWHAPAINASVREVAGRLAELAGAPEPRLATLSDRELATLALTDPLWGEVEETAHLSHRPFTLDASRIEKVFGTKASPLDDVLREAAGLKG
ncbi:NAD-dependent epimerase/dehydratase family protein [Streptomyces hainanensis]|uniref:NAD-dependent epimerase n=1 Tax=Streptomyces hainanensis TaxID=402648 RepID=A0A4R4TDP5_9ACTN|nr:NAD-dependent epimerase/dehydratase family protein [Streptomyces hainanensis]TDC72983.1 NAD-dependent epimerase [Streptomyces hainanensis]